MFRCIIPHQEGQTHDNRIDQTTFDKPDLPSTGVRYLLVNGTVVVDGGAIVSGVAPGRALTSQPRQ